MIKYIQNNKIHLMLATAIYQARLPLSYRSIIEYVAIGLQCLYGVNNAAFELLIENIAQKCPIHIHKGVRENTQLVLFQT